MRIAEWTLRLGLVFTLFLAGCDGILSLPDVLPGELRSGPLADAGPDVNASVGDGVRLSGAASTNPEGGSLSYAWTQTDGPRVQLQNANQREATFVAAIGGTYDFTLTVKNDVGSAQDNVRVNVAAGSDSAAGGDAGGDSAGDAEPPVEPPAGDETIIVASHFDADNEGWRTPDDRKSDIPTWDAAAGNPGGCIASVDYRSHANNYFVAPAEFLGDQTRAYSGVLQFDLRSQNRAKGQGDWLCVLVGGDGTQLGYNPPGAGDSGWQRFRLRLSAAQNWKRLDTEQVATDTELQAVLGDLSAIRIRAYLGRCALDNVQLEAP